MPSFHKVLIANRGEIALRVMRSCHALGLATVAVYSEPDARQPFVAAADEAVALGGAFARESYLSIEKLLAAARATGAEAIHPGYGFLSENAEFAQACVEAGLVFIGPSAEVIRRLGSKQRAKELAYAAGVPTVPGYQGAEQSLAAFAAAAEGLGYPLLLKASAGGGGKGMHVVRAAEELAPAWERARREAAAAFGDETLLLERYLPRPRHVEVQILGDLHGNLIHLYERDCSLQRRHQKLLEESPAPGLPESLREAMFEAALAIGHAAGYHSAGTVEMIVDVAADAFYFLEVNTRLQVEHPVTEAICGVDLVAEQLRIARGERLRFSAPPPRSGAAIEVRLCAEDPRRGYLPTTGELHALALEDGGAAPLRCELGVAAGSHIGIHYDSMLGKVIAHAPTRAEAAARLARGLTRGLVAGLPSNAELLARVLVHPAFLAGEVDTHFLERHAEALLAPPSAGALVEAALVATVAGIAERAVEGVALAPPAWRNVPYRGTSVQFSIGEEAVEVQYQATGPGVAEPLAISVTAAGATRTLAVAGYRWRAAAGGARALELVTVEGGVTRRRSVLYASAGQRWWVAVDGAAIELVEQPRLPERRLEHAAGSLLAPMPGKVVKVGAALGERVMAGAMLVVIEAMKMEHTVVAVASGTLVQLLVDAGDQVEAGALLAVVEQPAE